MLNLRRRLYFFILFSLLLFGLGTAGYMWLEDYSFINALYMTTIGLTTVGFGEVEPLSSNGRLFTIAIILLGVGTITYGFSTVAEYLLTAGMGDRLRRRRMMRVIDKLDKHIIVCGYGRVGQSSAHTLGDGARPVVVIDKDEGEVHAITEAGLPVIVGDATRDVILQQAGIERAWGLVVATGDDSLNLFIVLSARALNPDLYIVARSVDASNERKMIRAGANRVVSPYQIGGRHMANIMVRPHVTDFFDVITLDGGVELWIEELIIGADSPLAGKTVGESNIRHLTGVSLVALFRSDGSAAIVPNADIFLEAGDEVLVLGTRKNLAALKALIGSNFGHGL
jgi:voltage-gated potassium channel